MDLMVCIQDQLKCEFITMRMLIWNDQNINF